MRLEIPLREITLEELYSETQRLRNELLTHNHLEIGNAQLLTGNVGGILQSANFVSGSSGWRLTPDNVTGWIVQTATAGQRLVMSGTSNYFEIYDINGALVGRLGQRESASVFNISTDLNIPLVSFTGGYTGVSSNRVLDVIGKNSEGTTVFISSEGIAAIKNTLGVPTLDLACMGTGIGLGIRNDVYDSLLLKLVQNKADSPYPAIQIVNQATTRGDILFHNRTADPTSGAIGELAVVNGILKICTAIVPITWTVVGTQV